jgi:hypothetical protein
VGCESIKWVTTWSGALLEKLIVPHLDKKFTPFYGAGRFITVVTAVCHLSYSELD